MPHSTACRCLCSPASKVGGRAAGRSLLPPVGLLVGLDRDGRRDAAPAQVGPVAPGGVGLVAQHPVRSGAWAPRSRAARHPDAAEHGAELGAVGGLPGVSTVASVLRRWSLTRCTFVDSPPRERPSAWSTGSPTGGVTWVSGWRRAPAAC